MRMLSSPRTATALRATVACLAAVLATSFGRGADAAATSLAPVARRDWSLRQTPVVEVVKRVREAVVNIHSERTVRGPAAEELFTLTPSQNRVNGMGTGILIDPRGYIVTNQHVVEDVALIRVRLADGTTATARVLARDHAADLALLKIPTNRPLPTMPLGTATDLMVGETVIAIGNAYGYEHTVTVGVVSAVSRDVTLNKEVSYTALIQTDASINPGNSGGPLLNVHGELIGVNVAIRAGAQGIGFAIPVDTMIRVASSMLATLPGPSGPDCGLTLRDQVHTAPAHHGPLRTVAVERLEPRGPAARAGLQRGDVLLKVGDVDVATSLDVRRALLEHAAGDKLALHYRRGEDDRNAQLVLDPARTLSTPDVIWRKLGVRLQPAGAETVTRTHPQLHGGMQITEVRPDSPAARAGLKTGDVLIGLHLWEMLTAENVLYAITHPDLASFGPLRFYILRAAQINRGNLPALD